MVHLSTPLIFCFGGCVAITPAVLLASLVWVLAPRLGLPLGFDFYLYPLVTLNLVALTVLVVKGTIIERGHRYR